MNKTLILLPLISLLTVCQAKAEETVDSKRICALWEPDVLWSWEASAQLGITEPMTREEWYEPWLLADRIDALSNYCDYYKN